MADADDSTCRSILSPNPVLARRGETVEQALERLLAHRQLAMPVVEHDGRFIGMFVRSKLIALMLPRIVALQDQLPEIGRLMQVGFVSDTLEDVRARFRAVAGEPVERHLDLETPVLRPETSLIHALFLLHKARSFLPVVDEANGRLLGVVSTWDVLQRVARSA